MYHTAKLVLLRRKTNLFSAKYAENIEFNLRNRAIGLPFRGKNSGCQKRKSSCNPLDYRTKRYLKRKDRDSNPGYP